MDDKEKELRSEIAEMVREIHKLRKEKEEFIPGKSRVPYAGRFYDEREIISLVNTSIDFWLTAGPRADELERNLAKHLGVKKAILTNSGSSANLLAVSALTSKKLDDRLKAGDEIIVPATSFPTTVNPIIQNKLVPVFVDVELGNYNLDINKLDAALSSRTRGLMFAHTLGNPADMNKIMDFVKKNKLYFIEDNCDSLDSKFDGELTGNFGDIATYSFYPAHHMTTGEGGALTTNNGRLSKEIISFRDWGKDCWCETGKSNTCGKRFAWKLGSLPEGYDHKYIFSEIGYNLKMTDMQASVGIEQLKKLPEFTKRRKENFRDYYDFLKKYENRIILPESHELADPSWFAFPITVRENSGFKRKDLVRFLEDKNIETRMLFAGNIVRQPAYIDIEKRVIGNLENSDYIMNNTFFIGVSPVVSNEMRDYVKESFSEFFSKY